MNVPNILLFKQVVFVCGTLASLIFYPYFAYASVEILSSVKPLTLLVQDLAAPEDNVTQLLKGDRSPHHYQLKVSDRQKLQSAGLVVWVGADLESFLEKPLSQRKGSVLTLSSLKDMHWVEGESSHKHHHHGHNHTRDPHIWLDPYNLGVAANAITHQLIELSPDNETVYKENNRKLQQSLTALDAFLKAELSTVRGIPFIVLHPAYNHFVQRYGLNQLDYIVPTPERGAGAKHIYKLRQQNVACIFGEVGQSDQLIESVTKGSGAKSATLDPLGVLLNGTASTTDVISRMAKVMLSCLKP